MHAKRKAKTDARWLVEMISITHQGGVSKFTPSFKISQRGCVGLIDAAYIIFSSSRMPSDAPFCICVTLLSTPTGLGSMR